MRILDSPITAVCSLVLGWLLIALKSSIISVILTVCGVGLLMLCIMDFIYKKPNCATTKLIIGIILIFFGWSFTPIVLLPIAILTLVLGGAEIHHALSKATSGFLVVNALITLLIGSLTMFNRFGKYEWVFVACGILLIIKSIVIITNFFYSSN